MTRIGALRQWLEFQTRDGDEAADAGTTVTYTKVVQVRGNVENRTGVQYVGSRGSDTGNTHRIEVRALPDVNKSLYVLVLSGPFKGQRLKIDTTTGDRLGRRLVVRGYLIGDKDAFVQPSKGTLPELF